MLNANYRYNKHYVLIILFGVLALLHLCIVLVNHYYFRTFAYYYGVYNFAFFDYAHFGNSPIPVLFDGTNSTFIQDHFSLLFILISPLYHIFNNFTGSYTLLVLQWIAIVVGGGATYRLVLLKGANSTMALMAMLCYFTLYSRFASYVADCNLAIIGSALVPPFLYYFEKKAITATTVIFVLLLITREDFSLWLSFICLSLLLVHRKQKDLRNLAAIMMTVSLLFFMALFSWIIPGLETETKKFALFNYAAIGNSPKEALAYILSSPADALRLLFVNHLNDPANDWIKAKFYLVFGLSGGLLMILRPAYLIVLIPLVAKKMYNDDPLRWGIESYYGIETASVLPALVFMTIADFRQSAIAAKLPLIVLLFTIATSVWCFSEWKNPYPFNKIEFYKPEFYMRNYPHEKLNDAIRQIPKNAAVSASGRLLPHLAARKKIYYFPVIKDADYLFLSSGGDTWPVSPQEYDSVFYQIKSNKEWLVHSAFENIIVFKKQITKQNN